ncbi:briggsae CBR-INX, partial [Brachionus plicatilis]
MGFLKNILNTDDLDDVYIYQSSYLDMADKLNWQITVNILLVFTFLVSNLKSFVHKIISCTVPIYFSDNQEEYANLACYISNKFFVDDTERVIISQNFTPEPIGFDNKILISNDGKETPVVVSYYIWVPYILVVQALLFLFTKHIWIYLFRTLTYLDIKELCRSAEMCKNVKSIVVVDSVDKVLSLSEELIENPHLNYLITELGKLIYPIEPNSGSLLHKIRDRRLCIAYVVVKILNFFNMLIQVILIRIFLQTDLYNLTLKPIWKFLVDIFLLFGSPQLDSRNELIDPKASYLPSSIYFPLKSMCIFRIRELTKTNSYAVMCSLPINLFIQYMFVFFSIWYLALLVINFYYLFKWVRMFGNDSEYDYVKKNLLKGFRLNLQGYKIKDCSTLRHCRENFDKLNFKNCS